MKRALFVPRVRKAPLFLPEGYRNRENTTVEGVARTGEISKKGLVGHSEDWEGRIRATTSQTALRYVREGNRIRPMTMSEMIDRGYFVLGKGPTGVRKIKEGIHVKD